MAIQIQVHFLVLQLAVTSVSKTIENGLFKSVPKTVRFKT
jgi:hypothetical protein